jgi:hypothetical protein
MWLAKWFGRRRDEELDDEPARHVAPPIVKAHQPPMPPAPRTAAGTPKGFDPYNSGTFQRRNAWERVSKR